MVLGMVLGAFIFSRGGWHPTIVATATVAVLSFLDMAFGYDIGLRLGEATAEIFR